MKKNIFFCTLFLYSSLVSSQGLYNNGANLVVTTGSHVYIDGTTASNYRNEGAGTINSASSGGTVYVFGTWTNNGSGGATTNAGSTVILGGSTQNISGTTQTSFQNLTVQGSGNKTMTVNTTVSGTLTLTGRDLNINGNTLTLAGTITGTGTLIGSNTSNLVVNGTGALGTLNLNNASVANKTLNNFTINRTSTGSLTLGTTDSVFVKGTLTISNGTINTSGRLLLISDAAGTARVAEITCGSCGLNGNLIVQRFVPGGANKRKWRYLSSGINVSNTTALSQLIDDIYVTGTGNAANGFDNPGTTPAAPSVRFYDETLTGSNGWINPANINATFARGQGISVFVRGNRFLANPFLIATVPNDATIDFIGTMNTGAVSFNLNFTNTASSADGFNLVGNPYPCQIDFDAASGWTKTNMQNKFWGYNPNTTLYGSYDADLNIGTNSITSIIASGQGFFVKATSSGASIGFSEAVKTATSPLNYFRPATAPSVKYLSLTAHFIDSSLSDETIVVIDTAGTYASTDVNDTQKLFNDEFNFYSKGLDGINLAINLHPVPTQTDTINLSLFSNGGSRSYGNYKIEANFVNGLEGQFLLQLLDNYTGQLRNLNQDPIHYFSVDANAASVGNDRFKLLVEKTFVGLNNTKASAFDLQVFPNPSKDYFQVHVQSDWDVSDATYEILDAQGRQVAAGTLDVAKNLAKINWSNQAQGIYFLQLKSRSEILGRTRIIRF